MRNDAVSTDLAGCRADMAELLRETVALTGELERLLDATVGWPDGSVRSDFDADPAAAVRVLGAGLLRKARVHTCAVLRANETSNLHSLAVQMRPVLECAGQVVFFFQNMMIAPGLHRHPSGSDIRPTCATDRQRDNIEVFHGALTDKTFDLGRPRPPTACQPSSSAELRSDHIGGSGPRGGQGRSRPCRGRTRHLPAHFCQRRT